MAIQRIPSFWDYLGQGIESFTEGRERRRSREERARQEKLQQLNFMTNLYGQGALPSGTLRDQINQSGLDLPPVDIMPSTAERRRDILSRPEAVNVPIPGPDAGLSMPTSVRVPTTSDDERTAAGLPTSMQKRKERVDVEESETKLQEGKRGAKDKQLQDAADRFVPMLLQRMGPAAKQNPEAVAEAAFSQYKQMLGASTYGNLPPADEAYARAFFSKAVRDALMEERKLDIQEKIASGRATLVDRRIDQLTRLRESTRRQLDDYLTNNRTAAILYEMNKHRPIEEITEPLTRNIVISIQERERLIENLDSELNRLTEVDIRGPRTNLPAAGGGSGQSAAVSPKVARAVAMIQAGEATLADLKAAQGKTFTAQEITQIEALLNQKP